MVCKGLTQPPVSLLLLRIAQNARVKVILVFHLLKCKVTLKTASEEQQLSISNNLMIMDSALASNAKKNSRKWYNWVWCAVFQAIARRVRTPGHRVWWHQRLKRHTCSLGCVTTEWCPFRTRARSMATRWCNRSIWQVWVVSTMQLGLAIDLSKTMLAHRIGRVVSETFEGWWLQMWILELPGAKMF